MIKKNPVYENPYIVGSPLTDDTMFYGRYDVFDQVRNHLVGRHRDNVVLLHGQRRTGKTSILYQMEGRLNAYGDRYTAVLIDMQSIPLRNLDDFLWMLARTIRNALYSKYPLDEIRKSDFNAEKSDFFANVFLPSVLNAIGGRRLLLMFDEAGLLQEAIEKTPVTENIYHYMRSLMQHQKQLSFIFSFGSKLETDRRENAILFNNALTVQVSFLEENAARTLITQPVAKYYSYEEAAVDRILTLTSGHPLFTQLLCHVLFTQWEQNRWEIVTKQTVDTVVTEATELALVHFEYLWYEATNAEKFTMAALADKHGEIRSVHALSEHLRKHGVTIADNMLWKTLRDLEKREIIVSIRKPTFSVHLVMYWIAREKRLNWIREDLREELEQLDSGIELVPQEELPLLLKDDHVSSTNHEVKRFAIVGTLVYLFMALFVYTFVGTPPLYLILVGSWERSVDGMHMVYIPEGPFVRGSTLDEIDEALELCQEDVEGCQRFWADDEYPQHMVTLHGFWIDKTEVSFGQYELCVEQAVCAPSRFRNNDEHFALDKPVVGVSWYNAQSYCDWAGATLPTEAQWEKAARGESGQIFAWGNSFDPTKLNFCDASCDRDHAYSAYEDGFPYSAPIDAFPGDRSPYGVLNMSGNVSEWVYDNYNSGFYTQTIGAKNPLYISETENALGIQRGGSWSDARFNARVADRRPVRRGLESESGGFRCAIDGATFDIRRFFTFSSQ